MSLKTTNSSNPFLSPARDYRGTQRPSVRLAPSAFITAFCTSGQNTTVLTSANTLYATPIFLPDTVRVSHIWLDVATGAAVNFRMALYYDSSGYPGARVFAESEIVVGGAGGPFRQVVAKTLPCGFYWGASVFSAGLTVRTEGNGGGQCTPWIGQVSAVSVIVNPGISVAFTYAALPDPFTAGATLATTNVPRITVACGAEVEP